MIDAVGYARKSKGNDLEQQNFALKSYFESKGFSYRIFRDSDISGETWDRPGLNEMFAFLEKHPPKQLELVVVALDRITRDLAAGLNLWEWLRAKKLTIVSFREGRFHPATADPMQRYIYRQWVSFADLERSLIQDRTMKGLAKARRNGAILGRPKGGKNKPRAAK